ncbi:19683_t:CDS:2 [Cetraspora pellucida]|uniref:Peptide hydrolase n=1 Tax=Cetraspora pellucida TaxID=1433469 RepID=A0A9N9NYY1_9GLOM|nr:19683_t:CDS:2 [Cetraspora pellucida]
MIKKKAIFSLLLLLACCNYVISYSQISSEGLKLLTNLTDTERLKVTGEFLKPLLTTRVSGTEENVKVQEFIILNFKNLGWHVEEDKFTDQTPLGEKSFNNIIVTKDINAKRRLVLAAHYDSKYFPPPNNFVGATDSAVPCAILIDLAHRLNPYFDNRKDKESVDLTLQIIFFDGEEAFVSWTSTDSLYGSRHLAEKWENTYMTTSNNPDNKARTVLDSIDVLVLLDLLGAKEPNFVNFYPTTSWMFSELAKIEARLYKAKIFNTTIPEDKLVYFYYFDADSIKSAHGHIEDDHIPFLERGVEILHIITYPFPRVWHTVDDNINAIDNEVVYNLNTIFRIFAAEYLGIDPSLSTTRIHDELI